MIRIEEQEQAIVTVQLGSADGAPQHEHQLSEEGVLGNAFRSGSDKVAVRP